VVYRYNQDDNTPCGYSIHDGANLNAASEQNQKLRVTQTGHGRTQYVLGDGNSGDTFETEVEYDEEIAGSPRVKATRLYVQSNNPNWFRDARSFVRHYDYDALGRLGQTRTQTHRVPPPTLGFGSGEIAFGSTSVEYISGTTLVNSIRHVNHSTYNGNSLACNITYSYSDDRKGNVQAFEITGDGATRRAEYTYTTNDQIETERVAVNNSTNVRYRYWYNNRGQVERITAHAAGVLPNNEPIIRQFSYNSFGQLENDWTHATANTYDNYGNCIIYKDKLLGYARGNLLTKVGDSHTYGYNHQGVRHSKTANGVATTYYLDGDKILGEDRSNGIRLRYVYDATGLIGVRFSPGNGQDYQSFSYTKDALGNIVSLRHLHNHQIGSVICHYNYTAFGETVVLNPNGTIAAFADSHIANINPFRWKSHYLDTETNWYYIDGKYYDPTICGYISVDRPENLLHNAGVVGGLNRYGITIDNPVALIAAIWTIYTATMLYTDRGFERQRTWWENALIAFNAIPRGVRIAIGVKLIMLALAFTVATKGAGAGILVGVIMGISIVTGTVISGVQAHAAGGSFLDGALEGFANGVLFAGVFGVISAGIGGIAGAVKGKIASKVAKKASTMLTQKLATQPFEGPPHVVNFKHNHGSAPHIQEINRQVLDMVSSGKKKTIFIDRQLKTAGLVGKQRPDIIGVNWDGSFDIREIASVSQASGARAIALKNKVAVFNSMPNVTAIRTPWKEVLANWRP